MLPVPRPLHRLSSDDRAWQADWEDFVIVHFALPPGVLAPHVPYELDLYDGKAWLSLVWFNLRRMRIAGTGRVGRWLCRPISEHPFLNARTYVRHAEGTGICFLAEWIPNVFSVLLGPLTYGLPYRHGRFTMHTRPVDGTASLQITPRPDGVPFALTVPLPHTPGAHCAAESLEAFLLERYQAYTFHGGRGMRFCVAHEPWLARRADWVRYDFGFLATLFPWLGAAEFHSAHLCGSVHDVEMGLPHRVPLDRRPRETHANLQPAMAHE